MTPKEARNFRSLNNTLETVNYERVKIFRRALAFFGNDLEVSDGRLMSYLCDISPDLFDVHLLGSPEELMPSLISKEANRRALYLSENETECREMESIMIQLGLSEANAIAAMRAMFFFLAKRGNIGHGESVMLASLTMSPALRERAVFLTGKYNTQLPEGWTRAMPRELIQKALLAGVQDKTPYAAVDDEAVQAYRERGKTVADLEEDTAHVNRVHRREMSFALNNFFKRHPDPIEYTCQVLDISGYCDLIRSCGNIKTPN